MTMTNIVIKGQITATSKKQDGKFKQQVPTKTAFISTSETEAKKLIDFGLTQYTSQNGENYFILKFPSDVMIYLPNGMGTKRPDLSQITIDGIETNNFKTLDNKELAFNILKGNHMNNDFFRLQAIRIEEDSDIEEIKPENPFGDHEAF